MADKKTQMRDDQRTLQSNIKYNYKDLTKYSLFLGGLNVKAKALEQYDPLKTGYTRIFFVQIIKSASLPVLIEPTRLSSFKILAGLIVMALIASYSSIPSFAA